jgi:hypothetical protein
LTVVVVQLKGNSIPAALNKAVKSIVQHLELISFESRKISLIMLYFKLDMANRVWFLWGSHAKYISDAETSRMHSQTQSDWMIDKPFSV